MLVHLIRGWLAALLLLASTGAALPHAVLLETTPPGDAALTAAPERVILRFNEPIAPIRVGLLDATGRTLTGPAAVTSRDAVVTIELPPGLGAGLYFVSYRVTSADGHPVAGSFRFTVGADTAGAVPTALPGGWDALWEALVVIARLLVYASLMMAAGGFLFLALIDEARAPRSPLLPWPRRLALLAMVALVLGLGLHGAQLAGAAPRELLTAEPWRLAAAAPLGRSVAVALAGLALLLVGLGLRPRPAGWLLGGAGAVLAATSFAWTGHAATAPPSLLARPAVALHTLAVAFWLGALWPLHRATTRLTDATLAGLLRRFSRRAALAVAVLLAAGTLLATLQLRAPNALWATDYGRLIVVKLGLVVLLLALAGYNKWRLTPAIAAGEPMARQRLRASIRAELAAAALILLVTGALGQTTPPRVLHDHHAHHHDHHRDEVAPGRTVVVAARGGVATVTVSPARAGTNRIEVELADAAGVPLDALEVTTELAAPALGLEPLRRELARSGPGRFTLTTDDLALPGPWELRIDALVDDFTKLIFRTGMPIDPA
jgi:copper transport protein